MKAIVALSMLVKQTICPNRLKFGTSLSTHVANSRQPVEGRDLHDSFHKNEWIARCHGREVCSVEAALAAPAGERPQNRPKMAFRSLSCS